MKSPRRAAAAALAALLLGPALLAAAPDVVEQTLDDLKKTAPRVFIDCDRCDNAYIKQEISFVNYVRDPREADVHVLITQQATGGGGREYTLAFIGQRDCAALQNTLTFYSDRTMTDDDLRVGLVQILKLGLAPYVARTPMARTLRLQLLGKVKSNAVADKWNHWVFNFSLRGRLNGEETRASTSLTGSASVNRVTPESKFRLSSWAYFDESRFDYEDTDYISSSNTKTLDGLYVKSVDDHWSVGAAANVSSSTYGNFALSTSFKPAVEYDIFPYAEATRRQLRILYKVGFNYDRYIEKTIYGKTSDRLWDQSLSATLEFNEPWGSSWLAVEGSHYFHDFGKNRVVVSGDIEVRLFRGLSLTANGRYSAVRDQLNLAQEEASLEELLLRRKELASNYRYNLSVGFSYSFGSVFSNVVNPRFGSSSRYDD